MVKIKLTYYDGHTEFRVCENKTSAEWIAKMEGDHVVKWEYVGVDLNE